MAAASRLDSNHHTFLQAVMKRGPLSEKATMGIYKSLVLSTGEGFVQFLLAINKELEFVQLELKKVMNQYDGKEFYGVINTLPSKEAKLGTQFTQAQILFFKAVMEAIVQEPTASGVISSMKTMYLKLEPQQSDSQDASTQTAPIKMTMQARQEATALLVAEQLLASTDDGGVALGVKAFLELRSVFRNLEVPFCEICNEAAIKAQLCSTRDCSKRVHVYCLARGSQSRNQRPKCPGCRSEWAQPGEQERPGDQEWTEDDGYTEPIATQEPVQTSIAATTSKRIRRVPLADEEEEEPLRRRRRVPLSQDDEEAEPLTRRRRVVVSHDDEEAEPLTRRRRVVVSHDDEEEEPLRRRRRVPLSHDDEEGEPLTRRVPLSRDDEEVHLEENGPNSHEDRLQPFRSTRSSRHLGR